VLSIRFPHRLITVSAIAAVLGALLVVTPAVRSEAADEPSVTPNTGSVVGGTATTISVPGLAGNIYGSATSEDSAILGPDGLIWASWGPQWTAPAGVTFKKVSSTTDYSHAYVVAISSDDKIYRGDTSTFTLTQVTNWPADETPIDTWNYSAVLTENTTTHARSLYQPEGCKWTAPGNPNFASASGAVFKVNGAEYGVSALDVNGNAYNGTDKFGGSCGTLALVSDITAPATLTANYAVVIDANGRLFRPWGGAWPNQPAGVTFVSASGRHTGSTATISAVSSTGTAYTAETSYLAFNTIAVPEKIVATYDLVAMKGESGALYTPWGTSWGPVPPTPLVQISGKAYDGSIFRLTAIGANGVVYTAYGDPSGPGGTWTTTGLQPATVQGAPYTVTGVTFGGVAATGVSQSADKVTVTATAPAHAPGAVDVVVSTKKSDNSAGPTFTVPSGFTYVVPAPVVSQVGTLKSGFHKLTGTGIAGSSIVVTAAGSSPWSSQVTVDAQGTWSVSVPGGTAVPLSVVQRISGSDSASVSVATLPVAGIQVAVSANPTSVMAVGDSTTVTVSATNSGGVALAPSVVLSSSDAHNTVPSVASTCTVPASLAVGESWSCAVSYVVTQADLDAGKVTFTARAEGTSWDQVTVTDEKSAVVSTDLQTGLDLVFPTVTATTAGVAVPLSVSVKNTGNAAASQVKAVVGVGFAGSGTPPVFTCGSPVGAGATVTCTGSYTPTQADIDRVPSGLDVPVVVSVLQIDQSTTTKSVAGHIAVTQSPSVGVVLSATGSPVRAGDTVTFTATVSNSGTVSLSAPSVTTGSPGVSLPTWSNCPSAAFAPGATVSCSVVYTVTQADVDHGSVTATVTASASDPAHAVVSSSASSTQVAIPVTATAAVISVSTSPVSPAAVVAGNPVGVSAQVKNTGTVTLGSVSATVSSVSPAVTLLCPPGSLAPGAVVTCAGTLTVTQGQVDAGVVPVTVMPGAATPSGVTGTAASSDLVVTRTSAVSAALSVSPTQISHVGEQVTFSVVVTNDGSTTVSTPQANRVDFSGTGTVPAIGCGSVTTLAPHASVTCTGTYQVTQADLDAAGVTITVTGSGSTPEGVRTSPQTSVTVSVLQSAGISVSLASPASATHVGESVTLTATVTNTGNVTVHAPVVVSATGPQVTFTCPSSIPVGQSVTCTGAYAVTQQAADAGSVEFEVVAQGTTPVPTSATVASAASSAHLAVAVPASIAVSVSASGVLTKKGDTITYTAVVQNTGSVTVLSTSVGVAVGQFTGTGPTVSFTCPPGSIAPNASATCTGSYVLTQADVDQGAVTLTVAATATTVTPAHSAVSATSSPALSVTIAATAALTSALAVSPTTVGTVGEVVHLSTLVTNSGALTVGSMGVVVDSFPSDSVAPVFSCPGSALAPAQSQTCTADYAITQTDLDRGGVNVTVHPVGTTTGSNSPVAGTAKSATVLTSGDAALTIQATALPPTASSAGSAVSYTVTVTNGGTISLRDASVVVESFTGSGAHPSFTCPAGTIAPNASVNCHADYTLTQADIDSVAAQVVLDAHAEASALAGGGVISPTARASLATAGVGGVTITASTSSSPATVGAPVEITATVHNTGTFTLSGVTVVGAAGGTIAGPVPAFSCPTATLAPDASTTCTATYLATQADLDRGTAILSLTTAGSTTAGHVTAPTPASVSVTSSAPAAAAATITASPTRVTAAGETITYTVDIANTGVLSLTDADITVTDHAGTGPTPAFTCPTTHLAAGGHRECTAEYVVTQDDIDGGAPLSLAVAATTTPATGAPLSLTVPVATVEVDGTLAFTATISANPTEATAAGETITYTAEFANTGTRTLHDLSVTVDTSTTVMSAAELLAGIQPHTVQFTGAGPLPTFTCPTTSLAPGDTLACTATYTITPSDLGNALVLSITAVANGGSASATANAAITITTTAPSSPQPSALPNTGGAPQAAPALLAVAVLTLTGAALLLAVRRRRAVHVDQRVRPSRS
jgi:LPXTG-motif cell wall-anchored protein